MIGAICALGTAPFINQIAMMLVQIVMNHVMGYYGAMSEYGPDIPITCAGIISKVNGICFSFIIGISQGLQPIISFNYGAQNYKRVKSAYNLAIKIAAGLELLTYSLKGSRTHKEVWRSEFSVHCYLIIGIEMKKKKL